jgi:hypothetical protein
VTLTSLPGIYLVPEGTEATLANQSTADDSEKDGQDG